jgi:hypothetical protein
MRPARAGALNHRRPPYLDVLLGLTENSAVTSGVHVDGNGFWPGLQDWFQIWFVPAKQVCSAATTWAPSPTAAAYEDPSSATSRRRSVHGHDGYLHVSCPLAVNDARLALPNFYNVTIRIANVAARLAVLVLWLCDKLGSSASP